MFLLIFALCAIGRFGLLPCSRSPQRRPLCRVRECRFVGLLAALARKVFLFPVQEVCVFGVCCLRLPQGSGLLGSLSGLALAVLLPQCGECPGLFCCVFCFLSLVYFPLFGVLGLCGSSFPLSFVCRETQGVDFLPFVCRGSSAAFGGLL